jgi:hypothetical protein
MIQSNSEILMTDYYVYGALMKKDESNTWVLNNFCLVYYPVCIFNVLIHLLTV